MTSLIEQYIVWSLKCGEEELLDLRYCYGIFSKATTEELHIVNKS